jgi:Na+/melibiose symporter-like transporter
VTGKRNRGAPLRLGQMVTFATIAIPVDGLLTVTLIYMPAYFAATLGVSLVSVAAIFTACRTIDIPLGPAIGAVMDRTRSRFGRYRPWVMFGGPLLAVGMAMLITADATTDVWYLAVWLFAIYVGMTILSLAHSAWAASLARSYEDRARLFGITMCVGAAGALAMLVIPVVMGRLGYSETAGMRALFWTIAGSGLLTVTLVSALIPERVSAEAHERHQVRLRDYLTLVAQPSVARLFAAYFLFILAPSWASAMSLFFVRDRLGLTLGDVSFLLMFSAAAGIVGAQAGGWLAARIGKHRAAMVMAMLEIAGMSALLLVPHGNVFAAMPSYAINGFTNIGLAAVVRAMVADVADQVRLETGREHSGVLFSFITFAQQIGSAITIGIAFPLLAWVGYDPKLGAGNSAAALSGLAYTYIAGPVLFPLACILLLMGYELTAEQVAQNRRLLDAREAAEEMPRQAEGVSAVSIP